MDKSQSSSLSSAFSSGGISWNWSYVFDSSDLDSISGDCSEGRLSTWSWGFISCSTSGSKLNVNCGDTQLFESVDDINSSHHSSVGWWFVSVGLDFHTTCDSGESFSTGEISNVDKSVIPSGKNVADSKDVTGYVLWTEGLTNFNLLFTLLFSGFLLAFLLDWSWSFFDLSHSWFMGINNNQLLFYRILF